MKKFPFVLLFTTAIAVTRGQNVGIGTNTPSARLDVKSTSNYVAQFNGASPMYMGLFEADAFRGYLGSYSGAATDVDFGTGSGNTTGNLHLTIQTTPKMTLHSSGNVGIGTTAPDASALLDMSSTSRGLLIPRMTSAQRTAIISPAAGLMVYETTSSSFWFYNGTAWTQIGSGGVSSWSVNGTSIYNTNAGKVGIGTSNPISTLDIISGGTTSTTNALSVRNSLGDTIMRIRDDGRMGFGYNGTTYGRTVNIGGTGINVYTSNEAAFGGAIFPTDTSLVIWSNSNANNYLVFQPSWGNTGIGTYTPNAKLHLNGAMLIGSNSDLLTPGTVLTVNGNTDFHDVVTVSSLKLPTGALNGYILKSDASGNACWVSPALVEVDPSVGSLTDTYIPKWNTAGSELINSSIRENANGVGINGNAGVNERLYVNGNVAIPAASNYKYSAAKTLTQTLPMSAFRLMPQATVSSAGLTFTVSGNNGGGIYVDNGTAGVDAVFDAPVIIPSGATITGIEMYVRDLLNTAEVSGELFEYDISTFTATSLGIIAGTGVAATPGNTSISAVFSATTGAGKSYYIRFKTKENALALRIFGAKITYTVTAVN